MYIYHHHLSSVHTLFVLRNPVLVKLLLTVFNILFKMSTSIIVFIILSFFSVFSFKVLSLALNPPDLILVGSRRRIRIGSSDSVNITIIFIFKQRVCAGRELFAPPPEVVSSGRGRRSGPHRLH